MADVRALTKNAADPEQLKRAGRTEKDRENRFLSALANSLVYPEVRYMLAELLERAGLDRPSFDHSGSIMAYNEGRRSVALELRALLEIANADAVELLESEHRARRRLDNRAIDAAHTPRAEEATRAR